MPRHPYFKKRMHPRNIYKTKIDFKELALKYPEFKKELKQELTGKLTLDFKDEDSLRVLAKTLLKNDFDLDVNIPRGYLVPTIPLRLNYILWLEDIFQAFGSQEEKSELHGIDIGTGATCIYPLMAAKKNKWRMIGTDNDEESVKIAKENVTTNALDELVTVLKTEDKPLLGFVRDQENTYDFCMCNPPFFGVNELRKKTADDDSGPNNAPTGKSSEISVEGGEEEFIGQIINESSELKTKIRIYTTMVGRSRNLAVLLEKLKISGITNYQQVEFFQGHITRWGLAWTYCDYDFGNVQTYNLIQREILVKKKPKKAYMIKVSKTDESVNASIVSQKLKTYFDEFNFVYVEYVHENSCIYEVQSFENTWSHQRRKRREMARMEKDKSTSTTGDGESSKRKHEDEPSIDDSEPSAKKLKYDPEVEALLHIGINVKNSPEEITMVITSMNGKNDVLNQISQCLFNKLGIGSLEVVTC